MPLSRLSRRLLTVFGGLLAAAIALAIALPRLIDVQRFRPLIALRVQEATGRTVSLGPMALTVWPVPAVSIRTLSVGDSARYPGREALRAESLSIRVAILPLLRGRLALRSVILNRPILTLIRDARGRWNFDDLLARASAARAEPAPAGSAPPGGAAAGPAALSVEKAILRGGRILVYDDAVAPGQRSEVILAPIDATLRGWGGGGDTEVDLAVGLGKSLLRARARLLGRGEPRLEGEFDGRAIEAADLVTILPWIGVARPAGTRAGGSLDLRGSVGLPLERPEGLRFKGTIRLKGLSYQDASMANPVEGLGGTLTVDGAHAEWNDFTVRFGRSSLSGKLSVEDYLKPRVGLTLTSPRLDVNEILAILLPAGAPAAREPRPAATAAPASGGLLEVVRGRGTLAVKAVRFQTFDLSEVRASLTIERGLLTLQDLTASLYDGTVKGRASVDLAHAVPDYALGVRLDRIDVEPLLSAYDPSMKGLLRGRFAGTLDLVSAGLEMDPILKAAKGSGEVRMTQGSITSFSVLKQLAGLLEMVGGKGIGREETAFESLAAHLAIADGKARTDDLALHSSDLDLLGHGAVGLDATLDLGVTARFSKEATAGMVAKTSRLGVLADKEGRLTVPFALRGNLASPGFALDSGSLMRDVQKKKKEQVMDRLGDRLRDRLAPKKPAPSPTPEPLH